MSFAKSEYRCLKCECFALSAKENGLKMDSTRYFRTTIRQVAGCRTGIDEEKRDDFAIRNREMKKKSPPEEAGSGSWKLEI